MRLRDSAHPDDVEIMENQREHDYDQREPLRNGTEQVGSDNGNWDAVGSLKRNAKRPADEVTPLLGNNAGSSEDGGIEATVPEEWEGNADYDGLTWWHRPSVSLAHPVARVSSPNSAR